MFRHLDLEAVVFRNRGQSGDGRSEKVYSKLKVAVLKDGKISREEVSNLCHSPESERANQTSPQSLHSSTFSLALTPRRTVLAFGKTGDSSQKIV